MDVTSRFPVDFESLKKGDVISEEQVSDYAGCGPDHKKYKLKQLDLKELIESTLKRMGRPCVVKTKGNAIELLTDSQAALYTVQHREIGKRKIVRNFRRQSDVDVANLTDEERKSHDKQTMLSSRYVGAMSKEKKTFNLKSVERQTPGIENR